MSSVDRNSSSGYEKLEGLTPPVSQSFTELDPQSIKSTTVKIQQISQKVLPAQPDAPSLTGSARTSHTSHQYFADYQDYLDPEVEALLNQRAEAPSQDILPVSNFTYDIDETTEHSDPFLTDDNFSPRESARSSSNSVEVRELLVEADHPQSAHLPSNFQTSLDESYKRLKRQIGKENILKGRMRKLSKTTKKVADNINRSVPKFIKKAYANSTYKIGQATASITHKLKKWTAVKTVSKKTQSTNLKFTKQLESFEGRFFSDKKLRGAYRQHLAQVKEAFDQGALFLEHTPAGAVYSERISLQHHLNLLSDPKAKGFLKKDVQLRNELMQLKAAFEAKIDTTYQQVLHYLPDSEKSEGLHQLLEAKHTFFAEDLAQLSLKDFQAYIYTTLYLLNAEEVPLEIKDNLLDLWINLFENPQTLLNENYLEVLQEFKANVSPLNTGLQRENVLFRSIEAQVKQLRPQLTSSDSGSIHAVRPQERLATLTRQILDGKNVKKLAKETADSLYQLSLSTVGDIPVDELQVSDKAEKSPNFAQAAKLNQKLSDLIQTMVKLDDERDRGKMINFFAQVAKQLLKIGDLNTMMTISTALASLNKLPSNLNKGTYERITHYANDFPLYRSLNELATEFQANNQPFIPSLMYLSQMVVKLSAALESNLDTLKQANDEKRELEQTRAGTRRTIEEINAEIATLEHNIRQGTPQLAEFSNQLAQIKEAIKNQTVSSDPIRGFADIVRRS